jgi:GntR family transcriptional regulator
MSRGPFVSLEKATSMSSGKSDKVFRVDERLHLDSASPIPLYHQMEKVIVDRISKLEIVGRMMPTEFELVAIFGVSRATVKRAMDNLVAKGLLERQRGVGTRVIKHQIVENLARLTGYTEEMASKGLKIRTDVLEAKLHRPVAAVRKKLRLREKEQSLCIRRLRGTNRVFPVVFLTSEIPARCGIDPREDLSHSLYELLETKHRIPILWGEETIEASNASEEQARFLHIKTGDTVLVMERIAYTHGDRPIEYVRAVYRPDRYKYSIRLNR